MKNTSFFFLFAASASLLPAVSNAQQCRDPWVTEVVTEVYRRPPSGSGELGECNIKRYNNGSWANKDKLKEYVRAAGPAPLPTLDMTAVKYSPKGSGTYDLYTNNNLLVGELKGGNLTVTQPAPVIAAGGGNIICGDAGNVIAAGGGNMIGGMTAAINSNPSMSLKDGRSVLGVNDFNSLKQKSKSGN